MLYCILASVKSKMDGSASVRDSRTAALPSVGCQCGLNISYILIDVCDNLDSVVILRDFSF